MTATRPLEVQDTFVSLSPSSSALLVQNRIWVGFVCTWYVPANQHLSTEGLLMRCNDPLAAVRPDELGHLCAIYRSGLADPVSGASLRAALRICCIILRLCHSTSGIAPVCGRLLQRPPLVARVREVQPCIDSFAALQTCIVCCCCCGLFGCPLCGIRPLVQEGWGALHPEQGATSCGCYMLIHRVPERAQREMR